MKGFVFDYGFWLIHFDMCGVSFFRVCVWFQWGVWVSLTENGVTLALCHLHLLLPRSYPSCQFLKTKRYPLMFSSIVYNFLVSHEAFFFLGLVVDWSFNCWLLLEFYLLDIRLRLMIRLKFISVKFCSESCLYLILFFHLFCLFGLIATC